MGRDQDHHHTSRMRRAGAFVAELVRTQTLGVIALVLALGTGTAYAAVIGPNQVVSSSIKNGQVRTADLDTDAVTEVKIRDSAVTGAHVKNGTIGGNEFVHGGLTGADILQNSIGGTEINEASVGVVPVAEQGGRGRWSYAGSCDPESYTFVPCTSVNPVYLAKPGRVLLAGVAQASTESGSDTMTGSCQLTLGGVPIPGTSVEFWDFDPGSEEVYDAHPLLAVTDVLSPGNHLARIECNQGGDGAITYPTVRLTTVVLSGE